MPMRRTPGGRLFPDPSVMRRVTVLFRNWHEDRARQSMKYWLAPGEYRFVIINLSAGGTFQGRSRQPLCDGSSQPARFSS
jgi:hypothetical protein